VAHQVLSNRYGARNGQGSSIFYQSSENTLDPASIDKKSNNHLHTYKINKLPNTTPGESGIISGGSVTPLNIEKPTNVSLVCCNYNSLVFIDDK
jgi:hypothetical protein